VGLEPYNRRLITQAVSPMTHAPPKICGPDLAASDKLRPTPRHLANFARYLILGPYRGRGSSRVAASALSRLESPWILFQKLLCDALLARLGAVARLLMAIERGGS
jgi:hypothetical protein